MIWNWDFSKSPDRLYFGWMSPIDKLDVICCLTGWMSAAIDDDAVSECPPLAWWMEGTGFKFSENAETVINAASEHYSIANMQTLVKAIAASL
ncbi:MAG: hypothetical protein ACRC62_26070 [Microcoleus sp.]